ncbi:MAG TPA: alpha/beta hydrolase-fold protein [Gaiellaceae bacterium]|nr:alpha/beta hydrolase-fold protein [Gaiellaceae bacterium]
MTWSIAGGLVLALASAAALNWSYYAQHGAVAALPPLSVRHPLRSLAALFGNRRWLAGFWTGIGGWVLYVVALTLAPLSLVQACAAGGLAILAALAGVRSRRERLAVVTSVAGLVLLAMSLAGTVTSQRHANLGEAAVWMVASGVVAAVAASPATAAGLGTAAGVLYAAGDVGTKAAVSGGFHVWFVPALLACHGLAFVALQLAFQRGSALTSAGLATLWTNALPIAAGMVVFGEPLPGGALGVARIAAFLAVVVGAALLTRPGESATVARVAAGSVTALVLFTCVGTVRAQAPALPNFTLFDTGPAGGTVWTGRIPDPFVPSDRRSAYLYLPPHFSPDKRYPVLYLLHGFWGDPSSFVLGLHITQIADETISAGKARPFIAVMPPGGLPFGSKSLRAKGEWAGPSEDYIVRTVVPWADAHLPTIRNERMRAIAGVSAGAFGAVDMALRHVGLFGTAESWEGYFHPFRDGPFVHASAGTLAAHDPVLLARKEAASIRRHGLRFFLSTGGSHGAVKRSWTFEFDRELRGLGIASRLWAQPAGVANFGRNQLPSALDYAEPAG